MSDHCRLAPPPHHKNREASFSSVTARLLDREGFLCYKKKIKFPLFNKESVMNGHIDGRRVAEGMTPSRLLSVSGLREVLVVRSGRSLRRTHILEIGDLDSDIRDRGKALVLRSGTDGPENAEWSFIRFGDTANSYICLGMEFDYRLGCFAFIVAKNRRRFVERVFFPAPLAWHLLPNRKRYRVLTFIPFP